MCENFSTELPRFLLKAKSFKKCSHGEHHETDSVCRYFCNAHDLYRDAHAFYRKHETEEIEMGITCREVA